MGAGRGKLKNPQVNCCIGNLHVPSRNNLSKNLNTLDAKSFHFSDDDIYVKKFAFLQFSYFLKLLAYNLVLALLLLLSLSFPLSS